MADFTSEISGAFKGAITSTRNSIKNEITNTRNSIKNEVKGTISSVKNNVRNTIRGTTNQAIGAITSGAFGAGAALLQGDVEGALGSISGITSDLGSVFSNSMDISSVLSGVPGGRLSGPGPGTEFSGSRVPEGNSLQGILDRPDPMLSFYWYAQMPIVHSPFGAASLPWNYVETATPPFRSYDMSTVFRAGRTRKFASAYSLDNLQLGFYMDVSGTALQYLQAWDATIQSPVNRDTVYERGGLYGLPAMYQKDINIFLLSPARNAVIVLTYIEAWPQNLDALALASDSGSRLIQNVSFAVGDVLVNILDVPGGEQEAIMQGPAPAATLGSLAASAIKTGYSAASKAISGASERIGSYF